MIRATIVVDDPTQMREAYDLVKDTMYIQIIRVKNQLRRLNTIFLNCIFKNNIICEI